MEYNQKAFEIISSSIKSAIFIDENARTFFQEESTLTGAEEEKISISLYENFKKKGISLGIHKYQLDDESKDDLKDYLFEDRDLVILDWNLQGDSGAENSLRLLVDIIDRPHIHFCTIYTSESDLGIEKVFRNILSYFSNDTKDNYSEIKENLELDDKILELREDLNEINVNRHKAGEIIGKLFNDGKSDIIKKLIDITGKSDKKCALIKTAIALDDTIKSSTPNPCPSLFSFEKKTLIIENTIITILNKNENNPENLIQNISNQIVESDSSFTQLLGLEMQTIFSRSSSFIDKNLLNTTMDVLLHHRNNYIEDKIGHFFPEFIKQMMLEKAKLNIREIDISLLDDEFLDSLYDEKKPIKEEELSSLNTFYNSTKLTGNHKLNFGDVFKVENQEVYLICITALCDCLRPEKIDNSFFFAKGSPIKPSDALELGDTAFISYLGKKKIVKWTDVSSQIKKDSLHQYSPVYIKPAQFFVENPNFNTEDSFEFSFLNTKGTKDFFKVQYVTTIKSNYTQRIANHAFSHPIRVGVDFAKKK